MSKIKLILNSSNYSTTALSKMAKYKYLIALLVFYQSATVLATNLSYEPIALSSVIIFTLMVVLLLFRINKRRLYLRENIIFICFSSLFSMAVLLSSHINIATEVPYFGTARDITFSKITTKDIYIYLMCMFGVYYIATSIYLFISYEGEKSTNKIIFRKRKEIRGISLLIISILFLCFWFPYLIEYWPGFVFGDTINSINQIYSGVWNNHHPVLYTGLIKVGIDIAHTIGKGNTTGLALVNIFQMIFMAICLSYFCNWISAYFIDKYRNIILFSLTAIFGLSPYFATYSIAMWKDPIFSCSVVIISLLLADYVESDGMYGTNILFNIKLFMFSLVSIFFRNNGIYIITLVMIILLIKTIRNKISRYALFPCITLGIAIVLSAIVQGPVYSSLRIQPTEESESLGVPLNQMARVAALGGDMSDDDRVFMASLLPLDEYVLKYHPCCTDLLKWDSDFNGERLKSSSFFSHWISMFFRNPMVYLEAWALQTFGFWSPVNQVSINNMANISGGVPRNNSPDYPSSSERLKYDLNLQGTVSRGSDLFLPFEGPSIPVGIVFWVIVYLFSCLAASHHIRMVLSIVPSCILLATLVLASPIYYWPRYGLSVQLLLPMYLLLFNKIRINEDNYY